MTNMTELDNKIAAAFQSEGKQEDVNKVYLLLLRTTFFIPVEKEKPIDSEELFRPLFAHIENQYHMLAFDTLDRLTAWAGSYMDEIGYVELAGIDLIRGIHEEVFLGLNLGTAYYKEFLPDEIIQLKKLVSKIEQLKM